MDENTKITEKKTELTGKAKRLANLKPAWKKGEQGGGHRHKGQRDYATLRELAIIEIGKANGKTPEEIEVMLHQKGVAEALKGDYRFYKDDLDRTHGQAIQKTETKLSGEIKSTSFTAEEIALIKQKVRDKQTND